MAKSRQRRSSLAGLIGDGVGGAAELAEDILERAKDVEETVRDGVRDRGRQRRRRPDPEPDASKTGEELADLRAAVAQLTEMVNELAKRQQGTTGR